MKQERFVLSVTWSSRLIYLILETNEKVYVKLGINSVSSSVMNIAYDDEGKSVNGSIDEEISFICGKILNMFVTKDNWMNLEIYSFRFLMNCKKTISKWRRRSIWWDDVVFWDIFFFDDLYVVSYWVLLSCLDLCAILLDFFFFSPPVVIWALVRSSWLWSLCITLRLA